MAEQSPSQLINDWVAAAQSHDTPKNKATKIASLYVPDTATDKAVLCATEGIIQGQSEISADYEQNFTGGWVLTGISNQSINQQTNWAWAYGQWNGSAPYPPPNGPRIQLSGCWSILFVNQPTSGQANWLIQQHTIVTNPPSQTR